MLIDSLREIQDEHGWLPEEAIRSFCDRTNTPLYQVQAVAAFYPHFHLTPPAETEVLVCTDLSCHLRGGRDLASRLQDEAREDPSVAVHPCSCLGQCDRAPALLLNGSPVTGDRASEFTTRAPASPDLGRDAEEERSSEHPPAEPLARLELDPYPGPSDYHALRQIASGHTTAEKLIADLKESTLRGMGGAGFPTGLKWELVRAAAGGEKYVVCNADESEPGTFKDRHILECAPHLVLEGMLLAAQAIGAKEAILYLRHEYPGPRRAFLSELERARAAGYLEGAPPIRLFDSPGGYICGEETALLEALEGRRAEPRNKPPFPGTHGLWGRPTLINNVETFALATAVARRGVDWFKSLGENGGIGPKVIGLSGDVRRPGVYEIPLGLTLRRFIDEQGGGASQPIKAVCPGGASSGLLPEAMLDTPLEFRALANVGSMLGSGAVIVLGQQHCMLDAALNLVRFFRNESCGKCVPCRSGSEKLVVMLEAWTRGEGSESDLPIFKELAGAMADASICGLGQIAPAPLVSALQYWPDELLAHVRERRCPAGVCTELR